LRDLGYVGGYDTVRRYAKTRSKERVAVTAQAYVPLYYAPGEAYQFDWSHEIVVLSGVATTVKVAHLRLCNSRMMYVRAYRRALNRLVVPSHGLPPEG
jgi:transposase